MLKKCLNLKQPKKETNAKTDIDKYAEYTIEKFQGYLIKDVPLADSLSLG